MTKSSSGFTLIEFLIALVLWTIAAIALAGIFHNGLQIWKRTEQITPLDQEARVILEQMGREFENSMDVPGIGWVASDQEIDFATLKDVGATDASRPLRQQIIKVSYRMIPLKEGELPAGLDVPQTLLERIEQPLLPSGIQDPVTTMMTHRPTAIQWEYAYTSPQAPLVWQGQWKGTSIAALPSSIRIHLTLWDDQAQPETFTRTIMTPRSTTLPWAH